MRFRCVMNILLFATCLVCEAGSGSDGYIKVALLYLRG